MEPDTLIQLNEVKAFTHELFSILKRWNAAIRSLEFYEFQYGLNNITPPGGWASVQLDSMAEIEVRVNQREFYKSIQIKPRQGDRIVLDECITNLTQMLFVGLVCRVYPEEWVNQHFFFDVRGFYFLHRTMYMTDKIRSHLGGAPFRQFEKKQAELECMLEIGYKEFSSANSDVDVLFIQLVQQLIAAQGSPVILAIAGQTAAGKTEIVERLREAFECNGQRTTSVELDNFLTDREEREIKGIFTQGKEAYHYELLEQSLQGLSEGRRVSIPRYDFVFATSSHDAEGKLKPDCQPIEIEPADIIFIEGNFPFLIPEIVQLINIKVVYLTDDPIRMKRKWRRDIDLRKKYETTYFRNRFFKDQFIMAEVAYRPQLEVCDLFVDTTGAAIWVTPEIKAILG